MVTLNQFLPEDGQKSKLASLFSRGVRMVYADALKNLMQNSELLDQLSELENLPPEITMEFLDDLQNPSESKSSSETKVESQNASEITPLSISSKQTFPQTNSSDNLSDNPSDSQPTDETNDVKIIWKYLPHPGVGKNNYSKIFTSRYRKLSRMLWGRPQLKTAASISNIKRIKEHQKIAAIGLIMDVFTLKDGRKLLELEDPTGTISVLIPKNLKGIEEIVPDEVIGVFGNPGNDIIFAESIMFPDVPAANEWPTGAKSKAVFIADVHAGSKKFNEDTWRNFAKWVNKHQELKYIFVGGDLVDGVGIYKGQDNEIHHETVEEEFQYLRKMMNLISSTKKIIMIPGNHDPTNDSEPRQPIPREFAKPIYQMPNVQLLSDPSWVKVEGVCVLMYHGTSFDGFIASNDSIRSTGYDHPTQAQKLLLKKRHLSPTFGRNRILPSQEDHLVIQQIPHVFFTGHVHTVDMSNYRGVHLISAGSFQERTDFQKKLGHHPTPGQFVEMDLATGESKMVNFTQNDLPEIPSSNEPFITT